jgi:hypothetical protein
MARLNVPQDGRPQFTTVGLALSSVTGGPGLDDVQRIAPDRYILPNAWPKAAPTPGFSGAIAASAAATETKPMTPAKALWPNLP